MEVEDVPSARDFLPLVLEAIRNSDKIRFTYAGFNRSRAETDILFSPYFLKRYKQRWYMLGYKEKSRDIRTYALDRIKDLKIAPEKFTLPADATPADWFGNIIGVTTSKAPTRIVRLQATPPRPNISAPFRSIIPSRRRCTTTTPSSHIS